jgi:hypothetical protein
MPFHKISSGLTDNCCAVWMFGCLDISMFASLNRRKSWRFISDNVTSWALLFRRDFSHRRNFFCWGTLQYAFIWVHVAETSERWWLLHPWFLIPDSWFLILDPWFLVLGPWFLVLDSWSLVDLPKDFQRATQGQGPLWWPRFIHQRASLLQKKANSERMKGNFRWFFMSSKQMFVLSTP